MQTEEVATDINLIEVSNKGKPKDLVKKDTCILTWGASEEVTLHWESQQVCEGKRKINKIPP